MMPVVVLDKLERSTKKKLVRSLRPTPPRRPGDADRHPPLIICDVTHNNTLKKSSYCLGRRYTLGAINSLNTLGGLHERSLICLKW